MQFRKYPSGVLRSPSLTSAHLRIMGGAPAVGHERKEKSEMDPHTHRNCLVQVSFLAY